MELKIDNSKTYAIALEGGGARGAYEIGVWKALDEAGIKFNAVSGTSVGALNGALYAMGDLDEAIKVWRDIRISDVIDIGSISEKDIKRIIKGKLEFKDIREFAPTFLDVIKNRGLDVQPLRQWVHNVVDTEKIKNGKVDLFVSTVSISDKKSLEVKVNELPDDEICDMLLASAYHPTFKLERLGGKLYADGGFVDSIPIHSLVNAGYRDIIAVRLPSYGMEKLFRIPDDVKITTISTNKDLGGSLTFDSDISKRNLEIGYYDAKRVLYGLSGVKYYVEKTIPEKDCLDWLINYISVGQEIKSLRDVTEKKIPALAKMLDLGGDTYQDLVIGVLEHEAQSLGIEELQIFTDVSLMETIEMRRKARM